MMKKICLLFITCFIGLIFGLSGCMTYQQETTENTNNSSDDQSQDHTNTLLVNGSIIFQYPPFNLDKVHYIIPLGAMIGAHVTPVDHQYYVSYDNTSTDDPFVEVYSPADGIVTSISHMDVAAEDDPIPVDDYRVIIQHTTTISSYYIHIDELSDTLSSYDPGLGEYANNLNIQVNAGEVIGMYRGSVDYNVVDEEVTLDFINPSSYQAEPWKIHCPDPFDYFSEEIQYQLISKCLRVDTPRGGKICYDLDGTLLGSWFEEGTNGYKGVDQERYWAGHLSIVYDHIDPDAIIVSIGTFIDSAEQFAVTGNSPDPADITVEEGIVIYELTDFEYYKENQRWDRNSFVQGLELQNGEGTRGTIVFQLIDNQTLQVEIFPNEIATGFTENAKRYIR